MHKIREEPIYNVPCLPMSVLFDLIFFLTTDCDLSVKRRQVLLDIVQRENSEGRTPCPGVNWKGVVSWGKLKGVNCKRIVSWGQLKRVSYFGVN